MGQSRDERLVFTCQEIEQHLQSALAAATPDVWSRLDLTVPQERGEALSSGKIRRLEDRAHRMEAAETGIERAGWPGRDGAGAPGRQRSGEMGRRPGPGRWERLRTKAAGLGRTSRSWGAAVAACICLLAAGGGYYHHDHLQVVSSVEIDVNPSLRLSLNRQEKVLQVQALNEDGAALMDGGSLKGQPVGEAVSQVVDALVEQGYLGQDGQEHAILVSVSGRDAKKAEQLKTEVSADVENALAEKEVKAVVYDQTVQVTEELKELAQTYQVSVGKAGFVEQLIGENEALDPEDQEVYTQLMGQTMEELTREIDQKSYQIGPQIAVVRTGPREAPVRTAKADGPAKGEERPLEGRDREQGEQERDSGAVLASGQAEEPERLESLPTEEQEQPGEKESAGDLAARPETADGQPESIEDLASPSETEGQELPEEGGAPGALEETADGQSGELDDPVTIQEGADSQLAGGGALAVPEAADGQPESIGDLASPSETEGQELPEESGAPGASKETADGQSGELDDPVAIREGADGQLAGGERREDIGRPTETAEDALGTDELGETAPSQGKEQQETDGIGSPAVYRHVTKEEEDQEEEMEDDWLEEGDSDETSLIIRNTADEWSVFAPGDIRDRPEASQNAQGRQEGLTDKGKGSLRAPVYASESMNSAERRFLQKGPGAFSENVSAEEKKEIIWFGPGFALLNEAAKNFYTQQAGENDRSSE